MVILLQKEIEALKKKVTFISTLVEESVYNSVKAVSERNQELARTVIDGDVEIDRMEVEVEEDCLKILALYQPVAVDLRFIVAVLKMNSDLERIGDFSVNIAQSADFLCSQRTTETLFDFPQMSKKVLNMLRMSIDSLVSMDADIARSVLEADDEVDDMNRAMFRQVQDEIRKHPDDAECLIRLLSVSRYLERIADHTTNIAEDVIYMISGEIVRHQIAQF
ncbi:MAG: phosphate signaling complex protein PhoU [Candidatus Zixiibacteriota bacterium]